MQAQAPPRGSAPAGMLRKILLAGSAAASALSLASALLVTWRDLSSPAYRAARGDMVPLVIAYAALQLFATREFVRDGRWVALLALGRALAAYAFLALFVPYGNAWMHRTPGRYVYAAASSDPPIALFALVFLGRGLFNTASAAVLTAPWWRPWAERHRALARAAALVPAALGALFAWLFVAMVRFELATYSPLATRMAREIAARLDCATIRRRRGEVETVEGRGKEGVFQVQIAYDCENLLVIVTAPDGRRGSVRASRIACCRERQGRGPTGGA